MRIRFLFSIGVVLFVFSFLAGCGGQAPEQAQATDEAVDASEVVAVEADEQEGGMVLLEVDYPEAQFTGTPVPVQLPNLERPGTPPTEVMIPEDAVNLALNKPVTSSDDFPIIGELEQITNGVKAGDEGSYVELMPGKQWVQIDLEQEAEIYAIVVWHFHSQARAYHDVIVQISNDPEFQTGVTTVFNNDHDNSSGMGIGTDPAYIETNHGRIIDAERTVGRYVRLYSNGNTANDMNHYVEVEVHGVPAE